MARNRSNPHKALSIRSYLYRVDFEQPNGDLRIAIILTNSYGPAEAVPFRGS